MDKGLLSPSKAGQSQPSPDVAPRLSPRSRLQSILTKRRRVEQAWDGQRSSPGSGPVNQDELKRYHDSAAAGCDGTPPKKISPPPTSPASTKMRNPLKQHHQGSPRRQQQQQQPTAHPVQQDGGVHGNDTTNTTANTSTSTTPSLCPCHICHRRPTTRSLLDAYADCNLCGSRTCYICLRECLSPYCCALTQQQQQSPTTQQQPGIGIDIGIDIGIGTGTGASEPARREGSLLDVPAPVAGIKICSACAVEGLTEYGEDVVWCLDCVEKDGEMETGEF